MRKIAAREHRENAAKIAETRQHPVHVSNGEERAYRDARSFMTFTKGLPHSEEHGLVRDDLDPVRLRTAIDNGYTRDFDLGVPLGDKAGDQFTWRFHTAKEPAAGRFDLYKDDDGTDRPLDAQHRKWEAPTAGFVYDLQGPDAQAVTMPPAPPIVSQNKPKSAPLYGSPKSAHGVDANPEIVAEMAEVYWLALLRDKHLTEFDAGSGGADSLVNEAINYLDGLDFYQTARGNHPRRRKIDYAPLDRQDLFRGHTPGERKGPYLSQFMLMGDEHIAKAHAAEDGKLQYGAIRIDMRVRKAAENLDYMTHWNEWLDVQNGAAVADAQVYDPNPGPDGNAGFRHITTLRDLATYVHFDALYEAYLNACLWLLNAGAPFDPNFRHLLGGTRHTTGFALYGGPHILSLMTEVATRGLKAVRFQKFNNHLRLRPEALAGLIAAKAGNAPLPEKAGKAVDMLVKKLGSSLLDRVATHNKGQNARHADYLNDLPAAEALAKTNDLPLLPMAFPEGSPMHPSYGAGHATVAGACVTILKAFFDEEACLVERGGSIKAVSPDDVETGDERVAFVPDATGASIINRGVNYKDFLRVGDELNKLAANISIARNMAGVHYYSDYIDSLRMGEEIAIGLLQEQSITYPKDPFQVSLTSFDGKRVIIGDGEVQCLDPETGHEYDHLDNKSLLALLGHDGLKVADAGGKSEDQAA